jgi:hypothetical protein
MEESRAVTAKAGAKTVRKFIKWFAYASIAISLTAGIFSLVKKFRK